MARVITRDGRTSYIDKNGQPHPDGPKSYPGVTEVKEFTPNGLAQAKGQNGQWGYIDRIWKMGYRAEVFRRLAVLLKIERKEIRRLCAS